jgi:hypothetical protein
MHNNFVWFEMVDEMLEWRRFVLHHSPEVGWPTDWSERTVGIIETWNAYLEGVPAVQVEDPVSLARALDLDEAKVQATHATLGTQVNHWVATPPIDLSPGIAARLASLAASWGYPAA